jgi:N utilization substance protein A
VTRIETGGNIIVNLGLAEGFLSKFEILPNEFFSIGSTVQAYIYEVSLSTDKYQIKLSRTRNEFLAHLMASFVPEIANNLITIKAISREPGSRSKVAVFSEDETVDPVGACIGRDGIRIKAVRGAIGNERIDIIPWDEDITVFISNALGIEISKFILHEDGSVEIVCTNDVLETLRIGRRQKVRLVARLCRRRLKITSVEEDERRLLVESAIMRSMLEKMGFSETAISLYSGSDLTSVHDILDADDDSLGRIIDATGANMSIEDFRLKAYNAYNEILAEEYIKHGIDPLLVYTPYLFGISPTVYKDKSIYTKEQISQLDSEEVCDLLKEYLSREKDLAAKEAEEIVLWSRGGSVE